MPAIDALIKCTAQQGTVWYREYNSMADLQADYQYITTTFRTKVSTWHYGSDESAPVEGSLVQFFDQDGHAALFWTLNSRLMSGMAIAVDADQDALYTWWSDALSVRPS